MLNQLRQDNKAASLYNLVGFQTRLTFPEQRRIIRMIPDSATRISSVMELCIATLFVNALALLRKLIS